MNDDGDNVWLEHEIKIEDIMKIQPKQPQKNRRGRRALSSTSSSPATSLPGIAHAKSELDKTVPLTTHLHIPKAHAPMCTDEIVTIPPI